MRVRVCVLAGRRWVPAILATCLFSPVQPFQAGQGLTSTPQALIEHLLCTGPRPEGGRSELPFLVSRQAPIEGLTIPGTPREMGDDLHSIRRSQVPKVGSWRGPHSW